MGMDVLIPFAVIVGLTLLVFFVTHVVEGYAAPKSAGESLKRIMASTGGWMGGFLIANFIFQEGQSIHELKPAVLGALTAIAVIFILDMIMLYRDSSTAGNTTEHE